MRAPFRIGAGLLLGGLLTSIPACGGEAPDTPDATMQAAFSNLAKDDPGILWELMPPSYQKDVQGLITGFAAKVDPELYGAGMGAAKKAVKVLREKQDYVLAFPMLAMVPINKDLLTQNWGDMMSVLDAVVSSDLSTHSGLKNLDVGDFLGSTGAEVMSMVHVLAGNEDWPDLSKASAELMSSEGDSAKVKLTMPGQTDEEVDMTRVEGRWIPAVMAAQWQDTMKSAREGIAAMAPADEAATKTALAQLEQIDGVLDELLAASSQEQFSQTIGKMMGAAGGR